MYHTDLNSGDGEFPGAGGFLGAADPCEQSVDPGFGGFSGAMDPRAGWISRVWSVNPGSGCWIPAPVDPGPGGSRPRCRDALSPPEGATAAGAERDGA